MKKLVEVVSAYGCKQNMLTKAQFRNVAQKINPNMSKKQVDSLWENNKTFTFYLMARNSK